MKGIDSRLSLSKDQLLQQIESVLVSFEQEVVRDSTNNVKKLTEKVQTIQDLAKQCLDLIAQLEKEYYVRGGKYATFTNIILHKIGLSEVHGTKEVFIHLSKSLLSQEIGNLLITFKQKVLIDPPKKKDTLQKEVQTIQDLAKQCLDLIAQLEKEYYVRGGKYATFTNIILHKIGLSEVHDTKEAFIQSIEKTSYQHSLKKMKVIAKLIKQQNAFWLRRTFIFSLKYTVSLFDKFRKKTLSWIKRQCCL